MWQLGKRAFRSNWDCFSHSWEVICFVLCKCAQGEKPSWCVSSSDFFTSLTPSPLLLSITSCVSLCHLNVDELHSRATSLPLHLPLPFHLTHPGSPTIPFLHHPNLPLPLSPALSFSPSQVTPARPLIRILSLSKCIVTAGWQLGVCVCVSKRVWVCDSLGSLLAVTMAAAWHF